MINIYEQEVLDCSIKIEDLEYVKYDEKVIVNGRLLLKDNNGTISKFGSFCEVNGSQYIDLEKISHNGVSIDVYLTKTKKNIMVTDSLSRFGDIVGLEGVKKTNKNTSVDFFLANKIVVYSKAIRNIYDKNIIFDNHGVRRAYRYVELIRNEEKFSLLKNISGCYRSIHDCLNKLGYDEVKIAIIQDQSESGSLNCFKTYSNEKKCDMYLKLTSELYLRKLMISGFSQVFEMTKSFRNISIRRGALSEFNTLEVYKSFAKEGEMEQVVESIINRILQDLNGNSELFVDGNVMDLSKKWRTVDYGAEVVNLVGKRQYFEMSQAELAEMLRMANISIPANLSTDSVREALFNEIVSKIKEPTFIKNPPAAMSTLNKLTLGDSVADKSFLVINGLCIADIVNAERDPEKLLERFEQQQFNFGVDSEYYLNTDIIEAMRFGLPPCRGIGMGIERLLMNLLNKENIKEVEWFPNL